MAFIILVLSAIIVYGLPQMFWGVSYNFLIEGMTNQKVQDISKIMEYLGITEQNFSNWCSSKLTICLIIAAILLALVIFCFIQESGNKKNKNQALINNVTNKVY